ncbi:MAG: ATP-binding cassette domain-containing protein [Verrucomicrobiota bacterium]
MTNAASLLQVTGLQKSYNVPVLVDFSFTLRQGEVHALVGSNGAGKSTFVRILSGLTERDGGDIRLEDHPHHPASKREAEHAGVIMVLQELNVIGTMSIAENISSIACRTAADLFASPTCTKPRARPSRA